MRPAIFVAGNLPEICASFSASMASLFIASSIVISRAAVL
jgi:hypothetical protein